MSLSSSNWSVQLWPPGDHRYIVLRIGKKVLSGYSHMYLCCFCQRCMVCLAHKDNVWEVELGYTCITSSHTSTREHFRDVQDESMWNSKITEWNALQGALYVSVLRVQQKNKERCNFAVNLHVIASFFTLKFRVLFQTNQYICVSFAWSKG